MVNTTDLVRLWQHYDDQAQTPFTGAQRARKLADRIDAVLKSPNKTKLLRSLPRDAAGPGGAIDIIEHMNNVEFDAFLGGVISSSDIPACETHAEMTGGFEYTRPKMPPEHEKAMVAAWRPSLDDLWYDTLSRSKDIGLRKQTFGKRAKELGYTNDEIDYYLSVDPPVYTIVKTFNERENKWYVFVRHSFSGAIIDKVVGVYAYESQADAVIKAQARLDEKTLKEMWTYL